MVEIPKQVYINSEKLKKLIGIVIGKQGINIIKLLNDTKVSNIKFDDKYNIFVITVENSKEDYLENVNKVKEILKKKIDLVCRE